MTTVPPQAIAPPGGDPPVAAGPSSGTGGPRRLALSFVVVAPMRAGHDPRSLAGARGHEGVAWG